MCSLRISSASHQTGSPRCSLFNVFTCHKLIVSQLRARPADTVHTAKCGRWDTREKLAGPGALENICRKHAPGSLFKKRKANDNREKDLPLVKAPQRSAASWPVSWEQDYVQVVRNVDHSGNMPRIWTVHYKNTYPTTLLCTRTEWIQGRPGNRKVGNQ